LDEEKFLNKLKKSKTINILAKDLEVTLLSIIKTKYNSKSKANSIISLQNLDDRGFIIKNYFYCKNV